MRKKLKALESEGSERGVGILKYLSSFLPLFFSEVPWGGLFDIIILLPPPLFVAALGADA
jgi:hypothetical protein